MKPFSKSIFTTSSPDRFRRRIEDLVSLSEQFAEPPRTQLMEHLSSLHVEAETADQILEILNESSGELWDRFRIMKIWLLCLSLANIIAFILLAAAIPFLWAYAQLA